MSNIHSQIKRNSISINYGSRVAVNKNYLRLDNKPSINGIELTGNKTSNELSILSNNSDNYSQVSRKSANKADFLLLLNNQGTTKKLAIGEITQHTVQTLSEIPSDLEVGNYVFLLKEESINGSNKE